MSCGGSYFEVTPLRERGIGGDEWRDQGIDGRTQTHVQSDKNTELWNIGGVEEAFTLTGRRNIRIHTLLIRQMFYWKQFLSCSETVYIYRRHNYVQLYVISTPTTQREPNTEPLSLCACTSIHTHITTCTLVRIRMHVYKTNTNIHLYMLTCVVMQNCNTYIWMHSYIHLCTN